MNRQIQNSSRGYSSRSVNNLKSDTQIKSIIRDELRDIVNSSIHEYLLKTKIPIASIDIKLQNNCKSCSADFSQKESSRNIKLNISAATEPQETHKMFHNNVDEIEVNRKDNENNHWMIWKDPEPFFTKKQELKNYRLQTAKSELIHNHRATSPFITSETGFQKTTEKLDNGNLELEIAPSQHRPCSRDITERYKWKSVDHSKPSHKMNSIAVGPDKHYNTIATNTKESYHISDYLKKSLNLNDAYERKVFSTVMDVLRKKNNRNDMDSGSVTADPIIQLSEYKSKYQNPRCKTPGFNLSKTNHVLNQRQPMICPHKISSQIRPRSQSTINHKYQHGEQFLY